MGEVKDLNRSEYLEYARPLQSRSIESMAERFVNRAPEHGKEIVVMVAIEADGAMRMSTTDDSTANVLLALETAKQYLMDPHK